MLDSIFGFPIVYQTNVSLVHRLQGQVPVLMAMLLEKFMVLYDLLTEFKPLLALVQSYYVKYHYFPSWFFRPFAAAIVPV